MVKSECKKCGCPCACKAQKQPRRKPARPAKRKPVPVRDLGFADWNALFARRDMSQPSLVVSQNVGRPTPETILEQRDLTPRNELVRPPPRMASVVSTAAPPAFRTRVPSARERPRFSSAQAAAAVAAAEAVSDEYRARKANERLAEIEGRSMGTQTEVSVGPQQALAVRPASYRPRRILRLRAGAPKDRVEDAYM